MKDYFQKSTSAAPLAVFRIALGLLLFASIVRFWAKGWIYELYVAPKHFFPFFGFEFVTPLGEWTYLLFALCGICALMVALGFYYRIAIVGLFASFTYIELMDKSTYLNHYYFISMILLMMVFLPAHACFSIDARRRPLLYATEIPRWCVDSLKVFVAIVYFYAGLAKVNSDWLMHAQPLRIWLPSKNDLPVIGSLFNYEWVAYAFSWIGCLYDLTIAFLLLNSRTRLAAYALVVAFHLLTSMLFPIGMFPYIMMATALIFFSSRFHENILRNISKLISHRLVVASARPYVFASPWSRVLTALFGFFLLVQVAMPFRHAFYPGELLWTEEGYRFSWRVMLMEKAGHALFTVEDADGKRLSVDNQAFLTPLQEKMMSTQPDMMLQYAHILRDHYAKRGLESPRVYVDSYVALNGRLGRPLVDSHTNLADERESFKHKNWILPLEDEIKGI